MIARPWTDDLPKCLNTCVASYFTRVGGKELSNEDYLCFYCQTEDDCCLYGVFEPHNGLEAAQWIMQRMAAELLLPAPSPSNSDEEIREKLRNAFTSVEKAYIENYDGMIAERTSLQYQLQTLSEAQISARCDSILARLKQIDRVLSGGATVVLALVARDKLWVAHAGEGRALLARSDNFALRVLQLTADHCLNNEDELLRLAQLRLDVDRLRGGGVQYLGNQVGTRVLGNYLVKGLYRAFPNIATATAEPVVATPEIAGPITLDDSCRFLVLVSSGVYKRIQEMRGSAEETNKQLAQIIVEHFRQQKDFNKISTAVLQEIDDEFNGYCAKNNLTAKQTHMTLLIRNFNFIPPIKKPTPLTKQQNSSVRFNPVPEVCLKSNNSSDVDTDNETNNLQETNRSTKSNESTSSDIYTPCRSFESEKKIKGYVDFSCYYENVAKARKNGTMPPYVDEMLSNVQEFLD